MALGIHHVKLAGSQLDLEPLEHGLTRLGGLLARLGR
jgi:hypothetical protein